MGRRRKRVPFKDAERSVVWQMWREGALALDIAKVLGRSAPAVAYVIMQHGGIAPPCRRRSARVLRLTEREEISRGVVSGESLRAIGKRLGRAPSSISREIRRNGGVATYREQWPIPRHGIELGGRKLVDWQCIQGFAGWSPRSSAKTGLLSRLLRGS